MVRTAQWAARGQRAAGYGGGEYCGNEGDAPPPTAEAHAAFDDDDEAFVEKADAALGCMPAGGAVLYDSRHISKTHAGPVKSWRTHDIGSMTMWYRSHHKGHLLRRLSLLRCE